MEPMTTEFPRERVGLDIIGPQSISVRGFEYILVMVVYFTKWVEAVPLLRQDATNVANALTRTWISRWGAPLCVKPDCGTNLECQLLLDVFQILDIWKTHMTPYHPEGRDLRCPADLFYPLQKPEPAKPSHSYAEPSTRLTIQLEPPLEPYLYTKNTNSIATHQVIHIKSVTL
ncbi:unnamed protein product [Schistocephalus solidus]|uniref:Integrase catalytic domain-containing protein n=1 Tax=Schistocephalus solidus TaxID=70667 RepID=A0A183TGU0_SCHSO|nr:unnamed protein product [Schistocephalus solidus]